MKSHFVINEATIRQTFTGSDRSTYKLVSIIYGNIWKYNLSPNKLFAVA